MSKYRIIQEKETKLYFIEEKGWFWYSKYCYIDPKINMTLITPCFHTYENAKNYLYDDILKWDCGVRVIYEMETV